MKWTKITQNVIFKYNKTSWLFSSHPNIYNVVNLNVGSSVVQLEVYVKIKNLRPNQSKQIFYTNLVIKMWPAITDRGRSPTHVAYQRFEGIE